MPVIQIDKNGFIKGTKRKFVMKVIVKKAMMVKGVFVPVGATMDLEGAFLAECLSYNKVEQYQEPVKELTDEEVQAAIDNMEVEPEKLGPKKRTKKQSTKN